MQLPLNQTMHLFPSHSPDLKILQFTGIVNVHGLYLFTGKHEETVHGLVRYLVYCHKNQLIFPQYKISGLFVCPFLLVRRLGLTVLVLVTSGDTLRLLIVDQEL